MTRRANRPRRSAADRRAGILGAAFVGAGTLHFTQPKFYEAIMPPYVPAHRELVYASGAAEIAGGVAAIAPKTRRAGGWWLVATLLAVFPANVHMALHPDQFSKLPRWALLARLPLQGVFIAWALWATGAARRG
jgi:uncharacterized membrane protein